MHVVNRSIKASKVKEILAQMGIENPEASDPYTQHQMDHMTCKTAVNGMGQRISVFFISQHSHTFLSIEVCSTLCFIGPLKHPRS